MLPTAPILAQRVTVRPVAAADLADLFEINGDDAVTRFLPYRTWQSATDGTDWLARMQAMAAAGSGQQYVIERQADHKVIGSLLLFKLDVPSARCELGYVMGQAHWRQGYAKEAVRAACQQAFEHAGIRRIEAEVNPANTASNQLLLGLGFVQEGLLRQRWVGKGITYDTHLYGCLVHDWLRAAAPA